MALGGGIFFREVGRRHFPREKFKIFLRYVIPMLYISTSLINLFSPTCELLYLKKKVGLYTLFLANDVRSFLKF